MNVVDLDGRRRAAAEAETAASAYLLNRQADELAAIRRARIRRIGRSRITWSVVTVALCSVTALGTYQFSARPLEVAVAVPAKAAHAPERTPPRTRLPEPIPSPVTDPTPVPAQSGSSEPVVIAAIPVEEPQVPLATIPAAPSPASTITLPTAALPDGPLPSRAPLTLPRQQARVEVPAKPAPAPAPARPAAPVSAGRGFVSFEAKGEAKGVASKPAGQVAVQPAQTPSAPKPAVAPEPASPSTAAPAQASAPVEFAIVGAPTDEVILIRNKGEGTVRPVRLGQALPNGEVVLLINPAEGRVKTDRRTVQLENK